MSIILNIDTAVQTASVCLSENEKIIGLKVNPSQKDHAAWLHVAIKKLLQEKDIDLHQLTAVAISAGPGSYTGLRVGMAAAKGLCYALQIPLISINTLQMMAVAAESATHFICPMIDARRMEVFTALFDENLNELMPATNSIVTENFFSNILEKQIIVFCGNGSSKFQAITNHPNAVFKQVNATAQHMTGLSYKKLISTSFSNLAYSVPAYSKDFYAPNFKPTI